MSKLIPVEMSMKEAVETIMHAKGWTETQIGVYGGSSANTVSKILKGSNRLQLSGVEDFFDALGYRVNVIVTPKSQLSETAKN